MMAMPLKGTELSVRPSLKKYSGFPADLKESLSDSRLVVRPPGEPCANGIHLGQRSSKPPVAALALATALETKHEGYRLI
jgi:hypothetical protein